MTPPRPPLTRVRPPLAHELADALGEGALGGARTEAADHGDDLATHLPREIPHHGRAVHSGRLSPHRRL